MPARRSVILGGLLGAALADAGPSLAADRGARRAKPPLPWVRKVFHMFTDSAGVSRIREVPVPKPGGLSTARLLRRAAERVTIGTMPPGFMMDFHIANQPNYLIPIFGTLVVELKDGSTWSFGPGDILYAEDCTGGGHRSGAGPDGCFSVSVQIAKTPQCESPAGTPTDVLLGGDGAAP